MKILRIEGVNLDNCIYDTEDLSTRRGGGIMMLDVITKIKESCEETLETISTGASAGLFRLIDSSKLQEVKKQINQIIDKEPYCYGTFVINEVHNEDFRTAEVKAIALNRWQQMQTLSFSTNGLAHSTNGVCAIDELRPANTDFYHSESDKLSISDSVCKRRDYGKKQKQAFYRSVVSDDVFAKKQINFTNSFEDICTSPLVDVSSNNLVGKIAVFYADGNSFGDVAQKCKSAQHLTEWDVYIKSERKKLLSCILSNAIASPHWLVEGNNNNDDAITIAIETLLWGGDEVMFVVPAWCGLELAELFFKETEKMQFMQTKLTHACGLVFCHHQAPISRISTLAKNLADKGKENDRDSNSLNWLVLESFDHTGSGLDDYLLRLFNNKHITWDSLTLAPSFLSQLKLAMPVLKKSIPRSAVVKLIQLLVAKSDTILNQDNQEVDHPLFARAFKQITELQENKSKLETLYEAKNISKAAEISSMNKDLSFWLIIIELWDYFCEFKETLTLVDNNN